MKLISMTQFVLEQENRHFSPTRYGDQSQRWNNCIAYANFLSNPLELGMFVPCDEDGNVLEEPSFHEKRLHTSENRLYQQAKERVLFDISNEPNIDPVFLVEKSDIFEVWQLQYNFHDILLTPNAKKLIEG